LRIKAELLLQGCGLAILLMLGTLWVHISPKHANLYHSLLPLNHVYWGMVIDLAAVCVLATVALSFIERLPPRARFGGTSLWWAVLGALFIASIHSGMTRLMWVNARSFTPEFTFITCACIGIALSLWKRSFYVRIVGAIRLTLALLGVCIFWIMAQLVYMAIHPEPHEESGFIKPVPHAALPLHRIVWVVFDELSQDQVADHRQPGVDLPAFDRLRAESLTFTKVRPAGYYTGLVLPSLLLGKIVTAERSNLDGQLSVKTAQGWTNLLANESIFADAQRQGWRTGVAGWYNPYCRTYASQLDRCDWLFSSPLPGDYDPRKSVLANVFAPLRQPLLGIMGDNDPSASDTVEHTSDYRQLMEWSHQLIADEDIRFVFLHLPVPHPPGIYDRRTLKLGAQGSYLDNLVLADSALSKIMQWIAATKSAPLTTLVMCSDHSWRVPMWSKSVIWTAEDDRASRGKFDPRPVLIVRLPGETKPYDVSQPFSAVKEHDLVESLLKTTPTPEALKAWASAPPGRGIERSLASSSGPE
jgi:hypothetical protein